MIIRGVGTKGNDVNVIEDFSVHIPYGCCYDVDKNAVGLEPILSIIRPKSRPKGYKDGSFFISDETQCDGIFNFTSVGTVTVAPGASEIDFDILGTLKKHSSEAENTSLNFNIDGLSLGSNHIVGDSFRRTYKLVKDTPFLKAGYYTTGMLGKTMYNIILITSHHIYIAASCRFATDNYKSNEKFIDDLLNSMEPLNVKKEIKENVIIESFVMPVYKMKNKAQIGPLSMMIPDGFEYVTEGHVPSGDDKVEKILSEYALVCAPKGCKGGLRNFRDASLGINLSKPQGTNINSKMWKNLDDVKKKLCANIEGHKIKFVKDGKNFIIGYGKGNECPDGEEPYWVSYFIVILCGKLQYICNLYFNTKKSTTKNYNQAVEEFCAGIDVNPANLKKAEAASVKEALGSMVDENGKLDGIIASQLYSKDVIFNNDEDVSYDGKHTIITRFQMNSMMIYDYPIILNNHQIFNQELLDLVSFVEENENLMIPKSKFHPNILKATRNNPITGATIFELCAWHMLIITETDKNKYTVAIDSNLIKGIPDAFGFVGEFIKTLRAYNAEFSDFEINFESVLNVDGPCGNIVNPVRGAASGGIKNFKVKGDKSGKLKNNEDTITEIEEVSEEDYIASQISDLETQIADDILDALKQESKYAKALLDKISDAINKKKYTGLKDIDAVIERVNEAIDENIDIMSFNFSYMYRPFVNSYEMTYYAHLVQSDETFQGRVMLVITENTFTAGTFKPNDFPKSLSSQMDNLTEDAIYKELLESVIYLIGEGNNVFTTLSAEYVKKKLDEWGNHFEAQGTQYEGRNERIEKIHIGDQLSLKRDPNNQYDSNAIDLTSKLGSIGHLPSDVAKILAPALDSGNVTAIAEVVSVVPLSKRSNRAQKALLNVRIIVSENSSKQKKKTNVSITEENIKARMKAIEERKKARAEREKADKIAVKIASDIMHKMRILERTFEGDVDYHKSLIEMRTFNGPWDPKINEYFSMFENDLQELGLATEDLLNNALDSYIEIKDKATPKVVISIIEAIENAIELVEDSSLYNEDPYFEFEYNWNIDVSGILSELKKAKSGLKKQQKILEEEEKKQDEEDRRFEEAQHYGVAENDLDKHKKYLAAKEKYQKAKKSADYDAASREFGSVKGYLDANKLKSECDDKSKKLKPIEEEERRKAEETRKKAKAEAKAKRDEALRKYNEDYAKWEHDCEVVKTQRAAYVNQKIDEEKKLLEAAIIIKRDTAVASANATIKEYSERKDTAESMLVSLGFFKLSEKNSQKSIIKDATKKISEAQSAISNAESIYQSEMSEAAKIAKNKAIVFRKAAVEEYPMPKKPNAPN